MYFDEFCLILVNIKVQENNHFKAKWCSKKCIFVYFKDLHQNRVLSILQNAMQCWNSERPLYIYISSHTSLKGNLIAFTDFQSKDKENPWNLIWTLGVFISVYLKALLTGSHWRWLFHFSPGAERSACKNSYIKWKGNSANFSSWTEQMQLLLPYSLKLVTTIIFKRDIPHHSRFFNL